MNKMIKLLLISDILVLTGFGFVSPILAIFISDRLADGSIFAVGMATAIYWILKSILQLPIGKYVDSHDNKLVVLIVGSVIYPIVPILYMFATKVIHIYIAQAVYAVGAALAVPTWLGLWSTHLDRKHESFEWAIYSTTIGIGVGITGFVGAALAESIGFDLTFILVAILSFFGWIILFWLECKHRKKHKHNPQHNALSHFVHRKKLVGRH